MAAMFSSGERKAEGERGGGWKHSGSEKEYLSHDYITGSGVLDNTKMPYTATGFHSRYQGCKPLYGLILCQGLFLLHGATLTWTPRLQWYRIIVAVSCFTVLVHPYPLLPPQAFGG